MLLSIAHKHHILLRSEILLERRRLQRPPNGVRLCGDVELVVGKKVVCWESSPIIDRLPGGWVMEGLELLVANPSIPDNVPDRALIRVDIT